MKILHLYKDYAPVLGGIENHIQILAEAQAAAGHEVTVLVTDPGSQPRREVRNGVHLERAARLGTVVSTPLTFGFIPALRRLRPDIVHLQSPYPVGEVSQYLAGRGWPYVISYQSDVVRASQQGILRLYQPVLRRILAGASRILVTSQAYAAGSEWLQPVLDRCTVVPLGIDPAPFLAGQHAPLFPPGERLRLIFVGRHRYYKGVPVLLQALAAAPDLDVELLIAGDGQLRGAWTQLSHDLGLEGRVRFLGDVPAADLPRLYASGDVFVLPSTLRAEAYGLVLLEAMASGLPCLTTELGTGSTFIVQDEVTGIVVPPNDPAALAAALRRLRQDAALRARLGAAGRARLLAHFTVAQMTRQIEQIYRECVTAFQTAKGR